MNKKIELEGSYSCTRTKITNLRHPRHVPGEQRQGVGSLLGVGGAGGAGWGGWGTRWRVGAGKGKRNKKVRRDEWRGGKSGEDK